MKVVLFSFFALLLPLLVSAQALPIKVYGNEENSPVFVSGPILQDEQGMMWFVEKKTITKYNGAKFQTVECASNSRFPDETFFKIYAYQGKLQIIGEQHLYTIENDSIVVVQSTNRQPEHLKNVIIDHKGTRYFMGNEGLFQLVDQSWRPFLQHETLKFSDAKNDYVFLNDSTVATYTYQKALILLHLHDKTFETFPKNILDIKQSKGITYVLTNRGIETLTIAREADGKTRCITENYVSLSLAPAKVAVLAIDLEGNLWVTSQFESLIKVGRDRSISHFKEQAGIPSLWISNLYADRENNIWITYYPGICKISATKQYAYASAEGLYSPSLIKILKDETHQSFFVLSAKGTNRIRQNRITKTTDAKGKALISNYVHIHKQYLYSLENDGLYRYKFEKDVLSQRKLLKAISFESHSIILEKYDQLFVFRDYECYRLVGDQLVLLTRFEGEMQHAVVDEWDNFWLLLKTNYLQKVNYDFLNDSIKRITRIDLRQLLRDSNEVKGRNLHIDSNFDLWVVTSSRYLLRRQAADDWTKVNVFPSGSKAVDIWNVCESNKALYIVSNNGIHTLKLNDKHLKVSNLKSLTNVYASRDIASLSNSEICIEKFPGILLLNNRQEVRSRAHQVFINAVFINGKKYTDLHKPLQLTYLQNNITFEYSSNSFIDESANRFQFQLQGDKAANWSPLETNTSVNFSALSPGDYSFNVRGYNALGVPSENVASFKFKVEAVFWKTTWFLVLLFTILLSIISMLYWYRFRQWKQLQLVRNSISRDLHDHLGSSVSSISMLSKIASVKSSRSESINGILEQISKTATDAGENIDDIIWSINPKNDTLEATFIRIRNSVSELLESADIAYVINLQNSSKKSFDTNMRRDVYMICKEAFANVVKYSQAQKATLDISLENNFLSIIITDNGVGFELPRVLSGTRNGIKNIIQRVKSYKKATIQIDTGLDQGTTIKIKLPVKNGTNML